MSTKLSRMLTLKRRLKPYALTGNVTADCFLRDQLIARAREIINLNRQFSIYVLKLSIHRSNYIMLILYQLVFYTSHLFVIQYLVEKFNIFFTKEYFSIVLMAIVNTNYEFVYVNAGCNRIVSDGGVFMKNSIFPLMPIQSTIWIMFLWQMIPSVCMKIFWIGFQKKIKQIIFNYRLSRIKSIN